MRNEIANTDFDWPDDGASRRQVLKGLAAIGLSGPAAIACLRSADSAQMHTLMSPNEFSQGMERLIQAAKSPPYQTHAQAQMQRGRERQSANITWPKCQLRNGAE